MDGGVDRGAQHHEHAYQRHTAAEGGGEDAVGAALYAPGLQVILEGAPGSHAAEDARQSPQEDQQILSAQNRHIGKSSQQEEDHVQCHGPAPSRRGEKGTFLRGLEGLFVPAEVGDGLKTHFQ